MMSGLINNHSQQPFQYSAFGTALFVANMAMVLLLLLFL